MPDWSTYCGCPDHPYTLLKHSGACVSCLQEEEGRQLDRLQNGFMRQKIERKLEMKAKQKEAKRIRKAYVQESREEAMAAQWPRDTLIRNKRFVYKIISRQPSEIDNGVGRRNTWKVRVKNLTTDATRWLTVSYIQTQVRKAGWVIEYPEGS